MMVDLEARREVLPHVAEFEENLYHCASCNYCVEAVWDEWGIEHVCPTLLHHSPAHGYAGKGYIAAARAWFEGKALDFEALAERAFTCTTCGNCEEVCPIGMRPAHIAVALRAELADRGYALEFAMRARNRILDDGKPEGTVWRAAPQDEQAAALAFLPGCSAAGRPEEARAAVTLLRSAGGVRVIDDPECCGASLAALGFAREARARAQKLLARLEESGAARVAVGSAECLAHLHAVASDEMRPKLESMVSALAEGVREGRLALAPRARAHPPGRVGYLDSCHLTKRAHGLQPRGYAAEARSLLVSLGVRLVESDAAPRFQICCGAAGFMPESKPQAARRMADARLSEFRDKGADAVVTASPLCACHLAAVAGDGVGAVGSIPVYGLSEFLLAYFEPASGSAQS